MFTSLKHIFCCVLFFLFSLYTYFFFFCLCFWVFFPSEWIDFWDTNRGNRCLILDCDPLTNWCPVPGSMRPLFIPGPTHNAALRTWIKAHNSAMASQIHPCQVLASHGNSPFIYFFLTQKAPLHFIFAYCNTTLRLGANEKLKPFPTIAHFLVHAQMALCNSGHPAH